MKKNTKKTYIWTELFNLIWLLTWLYIIFGLNQSGWWILVPVFFHWGENK